MGSSKERKISLICGGVSRPSYHVKTEVAGCRIIGFQD
jgi:hypothetical protein